MRKSDDLLTEKMYRKILAECKINCDALAHVLLMSNVTRNSEAAPPFSELSADRVFSIQNRLLAVRNTRLEKQSSIYSRQMSKLNSVESQPERKMSIHINLVPSGYFRAVLK